MHVVGLEIRTWFCFLKVFKNVDYDNIMKITIGFSFKLELVCNDSVFSVIYFDFRLNKEYEHTYKPLHIYTILFSKFYTYLKEKREYRKYITILKLKTSRWGPP